MRTLPAFTLAAFVFACSAKNQIAPSELPLAAKKESLNQIIADVSQAYGIDENLFRAIVHVESGGKERVKGRVEHHYLRRCRKLLGVGRDATRCASSLGPAQVMGFYALSLGVSLEEVEEPRTNIELAAHKLMTCQKRFSGDKIPLCYNGLGGDGSYVRKVKAAMRKV